MKKKTKSITRTYKIYGGAIKRPNLWIMGRGEEEVQAKSIENIFNKIIT
jgi:hypothetical protein